MLAIGQHGLAATYTWSGAVDDKWSNVGNWDADGSVASSLPTISDSVVFPSKVKGESSYAVVVDTTSARASDVTVDGKLKLSGPNSYIRNSTFNNSLIYTYRVSGSGSVELGDNSGFGIDTASATLEISTPLVVTASSDAPAAIQGRAKTSSMSGNTTLDVTGAISGSGYLCVAGGRMLGNVSGDMSGFSGTLEIVDDGVQRHNTSIASVSPDATYIVGNAASDGVSFLSNPDADYSFAQIGGSPQSRWVYDGINTYTIGSSGRDFSFGGVWFYPGATYYRNDKLASRGVVFRKVGAGNVTFTGSRMHAYELVEGTLTIVSEGAVFNVLRTTSHASPIAFKGGRLALSDELAIDVSTNIVGSTSAIDVSTDIDRIWHAPLAADNAVHSIVKRGVGSLTLAEVPAWDGVTIVTVSNGSLVLPPAMQIATGAGTAASSFYDSAEGGFVVVPCASPAASVGGISFETMQAAVSYSRFSSAPVTLLSNVKKYPISCSESVSVVANGHTISFDVQSGCEVLSRQEGDAKVYVCSPIVYSIVYRDGTGVASFADGVSAPASYTLFSSDIVLPEPVKAGYVFTGWTDGAGQSVSVVAMGSSGDLALHANWIPAVYTLTFANTALAPVSFTVEDSVSFPTPERAYSEFKGWFYDSKFTSPAESIPVGTVGNVTVYAKWSPIVFEDDGFGEGVSPVFSLNADWEFAKKGAYSFSNDLDFTNELEWTSVSLPHSINAHDTFNSRAADAGGAGWRGLAYYRKRFTLDDADPAAHKYIVEFETVRQAVYLWVNGKPVGYYEAGIVSCGFDITDYVVAGENEILVCNDCTSSRGLSTYLLETVPGTAWGSRNGVGYQWNTNDFNPTEGGLTGSVRLHVKPKAYLTLPLYNSLKTKGLYVTASEFDFSTGTATVKVEAEVRNESQSSRNLAVLVSLRDAASRETVATFVSGETEVPVASDSGTNFVTAVESDVYSYDSSSGKYVANPDAAPTGVHSPKTTVMSASARLDGLAFWSPDTPHLYDVDVTLFEMSESGDRVALDRETVTTGFREVAFDRDAGGLFINGKPVWLTGYAQRSTDEWAAVGIPPQWMQDFDAKLLRDSGANFVRWMHVAPKPAMERAYDKFGVVNICPAGDKEGDPNGRNWTQRVEAMRDTIIYFRNSPSALFWEAGNQAISAEHMAEMTALRKALDPDGSRRMGCRGLKLEDAVNASEWVGTMLHRHGESALASMSVSGEYKPILECEYAREESPRRVWDDYTPPNYDYVCKYTGNGEVSGEDTYDLTQEDFIRSNFGSSGGYTYYYGNRVGGRLLNAYSGCAALCWTDSIQHGRNTGSENARMSGRVDPVRIPKPSFYAYQAAQSRVPRVKIVGHWSYPKVSATTYVTPDGTVRDPTKKTVYVVGSAHCASVELFVNEESVGVCTEPEDVFVYRFDNVDVTQSGRVQAVAYDRAGKEIAVDSIMSAGEASGIDAVVTTGPRGFLADGSDIAIIDLSLVDADGRSVPYGEQRLDFKLDTDCGATFMGGYNSGVWGDASPIGQDWVNFEAGQNRVFVRAGREAGTSTLRITCDELGVSKDVVIESYAVAVSNGLMAASLQSYAPNTAAYTPAGEYELVQDLGQNAIPPLYSVVVNDRTVEFSNAEDVYRPDTLTGVICPIAAVLDKIITEGSTNVTYTSGTDELGRLYVNVVSGTNSLLCIEGETDMYVNDVPDLTNCEFMRNASGELVGEFVALVQYLNGVSATTDDEARSLVIEAETPPQVCWWTGETGTNKWSLAGNWRRVDGSAAHVPRLGDYAVFTNDVEFSDSESISVCAITNTATLTFSGGQTLSVGTVSDGGVSGALLRLAGVNVRAFASTTVNFITDVEIVDGTTNVFRGLTTYYNFNLRQRLTGSGTLCADENYTKNMTSVVFMGDCQEFSGSFKVLNANTSVSRDGTFFQQAAAASPNASYDIKGSSNSDLVGSNSTYAFGALSGGIWYKKHAYVTFAVGARDDLESSIWGDGNGWHTIEKVGTNVLHLAMGNARAVNVKDGIVDYTASSLPKSLSLLGGTVRCTTGLDLSTAFKNSTSAISFDDGGTDATWSGVIDDSNTGGFVKLGAGTLVLEQAPLFTGPIVVREGVLVLPSELASDADFRSRITVERGAQARFSKPLMLGRVRWDDAVAITNDDVVATRGERKYAYHHKYGTSYFVANDVRFNLLYRISDEDSVYYSPYSKRNFGGTEAHTNGLADVGINANMRNALVGHYRTQNETTVVLRNLTPYRHYLVQLFSQDSTATNDNALVYLDGTAPLLCNTTGSEPGPGQCIVGEFVSVSNAQTFVISGNLGSQTNVVNISAIQVRELSGAARWDGADDGSTWDGTGFNWEGMSAEMEYWLPADGYGYAATIDQDAEISIGGDLAAASLCISNANVFLDTSDGSLDVCGEVSLSADGTLVGLAHSGGLTCGSASLSLAGGATSSETVAKTGRNSARADIGGSLVFTKFEGTGGFVSDDDQTVVIEEGESVFSGTISGEMGLTKKGAGTLVLNGPTTFTGPFRIEEGTVRVTTPKFDGLDIVYGFDASSTNGFTFASDGSVSSFRYVTADGSKSGANTLTTEDGGAEYVEGGDLTFGGKPYLRFDGDEKFSKTRVLAKSYMMVVNADEFGGMPVYYSSQDFILIGSAEWAMRCYGSNRDWAVFVDGDTDRTSATGKVQVVTALTRVTASDNRTDKVGNGFKGAIAELIGFSSVPTLEQARAVEAYLANKWDIDTEGKLSFIPRNSDLYIASGATLDLGGMTHTVRSLVLGGTVTNGALRVTGDVVFEEGATIYVDSAEKGDTVVSAGGAVTGVENVSVFLSDGGEIDFSLKPGVTDAGVQFVAKPVYAVTVFTKWTSSHYPLWTNYVAEVQAAHQDYFCVVTNQTFDAAEGDVVFDVSYMNQKAANRYLANFEKAKSESWEGRLAYGVIGSVPDQIESAFLSAHLPYNAVESVATSYTKIAVGEFVSVVDETDSFKSLEGKTCLVANLHIKGATAKNHRGLVYDGYALRVLDLDGKVVAGDPFLAIPVLSESERLVALGPETTVSGTNVAVAAKCDGPCAIDGDGNAVLKVQMGVEIEGDSFSIGPGVSGGFGGRGVVFAGEPGTLTVSCDRTFCIAGVTNAVAINLNGNGAIVNCDNIDRATLQTVSVSGFNTFVTGRASDDANLVMDMLRAYVNVERGACIVVSFSDGATRYLTDMPEGVASARGSFTVTNVDDGDVAGTSYVDGYLASMAGAVRDGGRITLDDDTGLDRPLAIAADNVTIDLNGHTLHAADGCETWLVNVGDRRLTVSNGIVDCGAGYGFWITDGSLVLSDVEVHAEGRAIQVAGAGEVFVDEGADVVTSGNDPALMIVGGFDGRAYAEISGSIKNVNTVIPEGEDNWSYAIAGRDDDLAGADIVINKGAEISSVVGERAIYHPVTESGYLRNVNVTPVLVDSDWLYRHGVDPDDLGKAGANEIPNWQSYVLGLDPRVSGSVPKIVAISAPMSDGDENVMIEVVNVDPIDDDSVTVGYQLEELELESEGGPKVIDTTDWEKGRSVMEFPRRDGATKQFFRLKTVISY